jgi:uncharacterized protein
MKTKPLSSRLIVALIVLLFFTAQAAFSQNQTDFSINNSPLPAPTGFVNDFAGVIDAGTKQSLESKITEFKKSSNPPVELAVVTVKTTGDRPIFEYSLAVSRGWGIGSKANDNPSALLLIAVDDRKYFTQVSRDLEDELPDGLVGNLQRQFLVPEFKKANYGKGISDTIDAYISTIKARRSGETIAPETSQTPDNRDRVDRAFDATPNWVCRGFCLLLIIIFLIAIFSSRGKGGGGSGGSGVASGILWAILSGAASSGGSSSSGGWSSDGGSSGGWGGFGGGGDFGGGGAGGDW